MPVVASASASAANASSTNVAKRGSATDAEIFASSGPMRSTVARGSICRTTSRNIGAAAAGSPFVCTTSVTWPMFAPRPSATKICDCVRPVEGRREHVLHDAYDLDHSLFAEPVGKHSRKAPARGRPAVGEVGLRERLVHEDRADRRDPVFGSEQASFPEAHTQRLGVARCDDRAKRRGRHGLAVQAVSPGKVKPYAESMLPNGAMSPRRLDGRPASRAGAPRSRRSIPRRVHRRRRVWTDEHRPSAR